MFEDNQTLSSNQFTPCFDHWVNESTLHPISRVIITEADAKASQSCCKLCHFPCTFSLSYRNDRKTVELTCLRRPLNPLPCALLNDQFLIWLPMILEHLNKWISAAQERKILDPDFFGQDPIASLLMSNEAWVHC